MKRVQIKLNHVIMKLFISNKVAFQTASLHRKEQIVVETKHKVESMVLFFTIFALFFLIMMAIRALIVL